MFRLAEGTLPGCVRHPLDHAGIEQCLDRRLGTAVMHDATQKLRFQPGIQAAFGWESYHLHQFDINGVRYSPLAPDEEDVDMDAKDETDVLLSKLLPKSSRKARWIYEYDFGDGWRHEVLFEGFPPINLKAKSPICLDGERACPPEDCGGPPGYFDYLAALADPQDERHEEMLEWRGPFDPEAFDAKKATKEMRKVR